MTCPAIHGSLPHATDPGRPVRVRPGETTEEDRLPRAVPAEGPFLAGASADVGFDLVTGSVGRERVRRSDR